MDHNRTPKTPQESKTVGGLRATNERLTTVVTLR